MKTNRVQVWEDIEKPIPPRNSQLVECSPLHGKLLIGLGKVVNDRIDLLVEKQVQRNQKPEIENRCDGSTSGPLPRDCCHIQICWLSWQKVLTVTMPVATLFNGMGRSLVDTGSTYLPWEPIQTIRVKDEWTRVVPLRAKVLYVS